MKINLPKHNVVAKSRSQLQGNSSFSHLGLKEIPLAYVNVDDLVRQPVVSIEKDFSTEKRQKLTPYDSLNSPDVYFFDSNNNIKQRTLKRIDNSYYYEPANQTEFTPLNFEVYLRMQRQQTYYNDTMYDIKVSAIETGSDLSFVEKLMTIFGDSYRKGLCPANIRFNGGSTNYMSLLENDYYNSDFVFIRSIDGSHYGNSSLETDLIDIDGILANHTNIWLFCDNYQGRYHYVTDATKSNLVLTVNNPVIYQSKKIMIPRNQALVLDQDIGFPETSGTDIYDYEYLNEAMLLVHKKYNGYIVISPTWFLDDLNIVAPVIYDGIMKCYLSSYYKSRTLSTWITDEPVDYQAYRYNRFRRKHNRITLDDFLADEQHNPDSYKIVDVRVTTPYVKYDGITSDNEILFSKVGGVHDPQKAANEVSLYTTKHTVINYKPEDLFLVETAVNLEFTSTDNVFFLIVHPYISSEKCIYTATDQTFKIEDLTIKYNLFVGKGSTDLQNTFFLLKENETPELSYVKVASIMFKTEQVPQAYDIRISGGGLPEDQDNDYDMLDIGHVLGRPYRVGSTLIIRLPLKFQGYEERIMSEVDKHISAGDAYVLIFEKRS